MTGRSGRAGGTCARGDWISATVGFAAPVALAAMAFAGYFDGLELVEPGVVLVADWRPDPGVSRGPEIPQIGAVGRKR